MNEGRGKTYKRKLARYHRIHVILIMTFDKLGISIKVVQCSRNFLPEEAERQACGFFNKNSP